MGALDKLRDYLFNKEKSRVRKALDKKKTPKEKKNQQRKNAFQEFDELRKRDQKEKEKFLIEQRKLFGTLKNRRKGK